MDDEVEFQIKAYEQAVKAGKSYVHGCASNLDQKIAEAERILIAMDEELKDALPPPLPLPDPHANLRHGRALHADKINRFKSLRDRIKTECGV